MSTSKVGTLLRISGQVVRTHPVHPELTSGSFLCLECQTTIPDVEQQFKFTEPTVCKNPLCQNRRRFMLEVNSSRFVDFQKIRVQETQQELPRGSIPRRWVCTCSVCVCVCACRDSIPSNSLFLSLSKVCVLLQILSRNKYANVCESNVYILRCLIYSVVHSLYPSSLSPSLW